MSSDATTDGQHAREKMTTEPAKTHSTPPPAVPTGVTPQPAARPTMGAPSGHAAPGTNATASSSATAAAPRPQTGRGAAAAFFGVIAQRQTWLNVAYLALSFPLGLLYFLFLVTGTALGLGLAILWVGIPILLIVMGAWWAFAAFERGLSRLLLGVDCGPSPRPWEQERGLLSRLRAHVTDPSTWRSLGFVLIKFPLGIVSFALLVAVGGLFDVLVLAPTIELSAQSDAAFSLLGWEIDTWWETLPLIPLGVLVLFVGLHAVNLLAALWRLLAEALLSEPHAAARGAARAPVSPAAHPAATTVTHDFTTYAGDPWGTPGPAAQPTPGRPPSEEPASLDKEADS